MTEEPEQEPGSLIGEVEPHGDGEWLSYADAAARWKIKPKAVYRRIERGRALGRRNPETDVAEVWVPDEQEPRSQPPEEPFQEPRSVAVPDAERVALAIEASIGRALSPLHETIDKQQARIEELVRENERLRIAGEQRSFWRELWELTRRRLGYNQKTP